MALKLMVFAVLAIVGAILPKVALAKEFVVGDGQGWGLGVNYTEWAHGKDFFVGDSIVFKYTPGIHNVYKTTGPEFKDCEVPNGEKALTSGNDVVNLATPGRKWYICGFSGHCEGGQKLVITVKTSSTASPSLAPTSPPAQSAAPTTMSPLSVVFLAAIFAALMKVLN